VSALDFVVTSEMAAEQWIDAQPPQELRADSLSPHVDRLAVVPARDVGETAIRPEHLERLLHPSPIRVGLRRGRAGSEGGGILRVVLQHDRESIVLVERQAAQDDGVDDGVDGGRRPDAERHHRQRDGRERRGLSQGPIGGSQVVHSHLALDGRGAAAVGSGVRPRENRGSPRI
jgi:hypothetical protein